MIVVSGQVVDLRGLDQVGPDAVAADALASVSGGKRLGEVAGPGLHGGIDRLAWKPASALDRVDVDDRTAASVDRSRRSPRWPMLGKHGGDGGSDTVAPTRDHRHLAEEQRRPLVDRWDVGGSWVMEVW